MTLLSVSLLVFSIVILFTTILFIIWWKKYGKSLFSTLKDLKKMQNPSNFIENMGNLGNLEDFYKNIGSFGGQTGNINQNMTEFSQRMSKIAKKINKK